MSYLYKIIWQLYQNGDKEIKKFVESSLNNSQNTFTHFDSYCFSLSTLHEKQICEEVGTALRLTANKIDLLKKMIDHRSHCL